MIVTKSWIRNFRNYEKAEVDWNPKMNLITGNNAQGKTNLLESIVYLSLTRSHRTSNEKHMIRSGCEHAEIGCMFIDSTEKRLDAVIHSGGKTLMVNRNTVKRSSDFVGLLNVILFSPDDLTIFGDAPGERRKVMNQEIAKVSSSYLHSLSRYQSLLKNRNTLLKQYVPDSNYLDILDEQMIAEEIEIIKQRNLFVKSINRWLEVLYKELSGNDAIQVTARYGCCIENPEGDVNASLRKLYAENRKRDMETRVTNGGIHREDLIFEIDGKNLIQTASQGQKRMAMLSFKMSLLRYIKEIKGKDPVLLLDDVLSELDNSRQRKLIDMVTGPYQCFITATEVPEFLENEDISEYRIEDGNIIQIGGAG